MSDPSPRNSRVDDDTGQTLQVPVVSRKATAITLPALPEPPHKRRMVVQNHVRTISRTGVNMLHIVELLRANAERVDLRSPDTPVARRRLPYAASPARGGLLLSTPVASHATNNLASPREIPGAFSANSLLTPHSWQVMRGGSRSAMLAAVAAESTSTLGESLMGVYSDGSPQVRHMASCPMSHANSFTFGADAMHAPTSHPSAGSHHLAGSQPTDAPPSPPPLDDDATVAFANAYVQLLRSAYIPRHRHGATLLARLGPHDDPDHVTPSPPPMAALGDSAPASPRSASPAAPPHVALPPPLAVATFDFTAFEGLATPSATAARDSAAAAAARSAQVCGLCTCGAASARLSGAQRLSVGHDDDDDDDEAYMGQPAADASDTCGTGIDATQPAAGDAEPHAVSARGVTGGARRTRDSGWTPGGVGGDGAATVAPPHPHSRLRRVGGGVTTPPPLQCDSASTHSRSSSPCPRGADGGGPHSPTAAGKVSPPPVCVPPAFVGSIASAGGPMSSAWTPSGLRSSGSHPLHTPRVGPHSVAGAEAVDATVVSAEQAFAAATVEILTIARKILLSLPAVRHVSAPCFVLRGPAGDFGGALALISRVFPFGDPQACSSNIVIGGPICGGRESVQCVALLAAMTIVAPHSIALLRSAAEDLGRCDIAWPSAGFYAPVLTAVANFFAAMPSVAIVEGSALVTASGLPLPPSAVLASARRDVSDVGSPAGTPLEADSGPLSPRTALLGSGTEATPLTPDHPEDAGEDLAALRACAIDASASAARLSVPRVGGSPASVVHPPPSRSGTSPASSSGALARAPPVSAAVLRTPTPTVPSAAAAIGAGTIAARAGSVIHPFAAPTPSRGALGPAAVAALCRTPLLSTHPLGRSWQQLQTASLSRSTVTPPAGATGPSEPAIDRAAIGPLGFLAAGQLRSGGVSSLYAARGAHAAEAGRILRTLWGYPAGARGHVFCARSLATNVAAAQQTADAGGAGGYADDDVARVLGYCGGGSPLGSSAQSIPVGCDGGPRPTPLAPAAVVSFLTQCNVKLWIRTGHAALPTHPGCAAAPSSDTPRAPLGPDGADPRAVASCGACRVPLRKPQPPASGHAAQASGATATAPDTASESGRAAAADDHDDAVDDDDENAPFWGAAGRAPQHGGGGCAGGPCDEGGCPRGAAADESRDSDTRESARHALCVRGLYVSGRFDNLPAIAVSRGGQDMYVVTLCDPTADDGCDEDGSPGGYGGDVDGASVAGAFGGASPLSAHQRPRSPPDVEAVASPLMPRHAQGAMIPSAPVGAFFPRIPDREYRMEGGNECDAVSHMHDRDSDSSAAKHDSESGELPPAVAAAVAAGSAACAAHPAVKSPHASSGLLEGRCLDVLLLPPHVPRVASEELPPWTAALEARYREEHHRAVSMQSP